MAKDGTNRGGKRYNSGGRPRNKAVDKILDGKPLEAVDFTDIHDFAADEIPEGTEMPKVAEYLNATQKDGTKWIAGELYTATWLWLKARDCDKLINGGQIEAYAVAWARYVQCQRAISEFGFLAKHPTTGQPIESPFIKMAERFYKQMIVTWGQIYGAVRENCMKQIDGLSPHDALMASLID